MKRIIPSLLLAANAYGQDTLQDRFDHLAIPYPGIFRAVLDAVEEASGVPRASPGSDRSLRQGLEGESADPLDRGHRRHHVH